MKRLFCKVRNGAGLPVVLGALVALPVGCGAFGVRGFLELERCDILNCNGFFFSPIDDEAADDHDDMAGMDGMDNAGAHDDEGDDHLQGMDDHDGDDDDDHMDDMDDHDGDDDHMDEHDDDDAEEEEHDEATEGDDGSGSGVGRS